MRNKNNVLLNNNGSKSVESFHKILGVDSLNDVVLSKKNEKSFYKFLKKDLPKHDLVIVSDYGHGLISNKSANLICKLSKYLALNAQVNAANIGYHSMSKYKNLHCLIVNEKELRHEMRDKKNKIGYLIKKFSSNHTINNIVVTQGVPFIPANVLDAVPYTENCTSLAYYISLYNVLFMFTKRRNLTK